MNENEFASVLESLVDEVAALLEEEREEFCIGGDELSDAVVTGYEEGMYLTDNSGFVVRLADGSEFQVTVKQSK